MEAGVNPNALVCLAIPAVLLALVALAVRVSGPADEHWLDEP